MAEPYLKYRKRFTSSLKNELVPLFDGLAQQTRIPKSRLLEKPSRTCSRNTIMKSPKNKKRAVWRAFCIPVGRLCRNGA